MTDAVRFAPSPTGRLHVGNARIALVNWLFARRTGARFLLRFDDTDPERSRPEFADSIAEDLAWLGLDRDETVHQSARLDRYEAAAARLKEAGRLYPCYETAEELEAKRRRRLRAGRPPVYDRAALSLGDEERRGLEAEGRRPHWRFRLEEREARWQDMVRGPCAFPPGSLSDPVLVRSDGRPLYTLSSAVDDIELGVTHVIRGEDHVANTAVQVQVFAALGGAVPAFAHLPLLTGIRGESLSKRLGSLTLARLREDGIEPMAINSYLALLGTSESVAVHAGLEDLIAAFDLSKFGRAAPKFDLAELGRLNARLLHELPFAAVAGRLRDMGLEGADGAFWQAVRPNLRRLEEARDWWEILRGEVDPVIIDAEVTAAASDAIASMGPGEAGWNSLINSVEEKTGKHGKDLYRPLRLALTGQEHGPDLRNLIRVIGPERAAARLRGEKS